MRRLLRNLCRDFGLAIANPPGVPTHRSGSSIDLVLASRVLVIRNMVVHDGHSCGTEATAPCWPRVRDWRALVQALRPQLLSWSAKVSSFRRDGCHYSANACRSMLDVLYGEFVQMFWVAANPRDSIKRQNRRPQPDWWDDECYDKMVSRNAAWRCWCRERGKSFGPNGLSFIIWSVARRQLLACLARDEGQGFLRQPTHRCQEYPPSIWSHSSPITNQHEASCVSQWDSGRCCVP